MKTIHVLLFSVLLLGCGSGPVVWTTPIDCGADEVAVGLASNGINLVALGTKAMAGPVRSSMLLQALSPEGKTLWRQEYREGELNVAGGIAANPSGEVFVAGRTRVDEQDMCVVAKYRVNGMLAWHRALAVGDWSSGHGIALAGDDILVCGVARDGERQEMMVARLGRDGNLVWSKNYRFGAVAAGVRVAAVEDGAVVAGHAGTAENPDIIVARLDTDGDTVWTRTYDSGGEDRCGDVAVDMFGNVVATGTAVVDGAARCVILEYHPDGELIRKTAYGEEMNATGRAICGTDDGDIYVAGTLLGDGRTSMLAFHYQPTARNVWERTWREELDVEAADLVVGDAVFLLGTQERSEADRDMVVVRLQRNVPANQAAR